MNAINKGILILASCFLMASCDVKIKSDMKFSNIFSANKKVVMTDLSVGTHCDKSYNDKVVQIFEKRGIKARYIECLWDTMNGYYYSKFSVPMQIVKGDEKPEDKYAMLYFRYKDNQLTIETSPDYADFIKQDGNDITFRDLEFEFVNDTQNTIFIQPSMSFVNDKPIENETMEVESFAKITIKLPDVSHQILKRSNVVYPVFQVINQNQLSTDSDNTLPAQTADRNIFLNKKLMETITPEQMEEYIAQGADVNVRDRESATPLMLAARSNKNPQIIKILLRYGSDIKARDGYGQTPLMLAAIQNENPEVIKTLIKYGSDIEAKRNGITALVFACAYNSNVQVIQTLIDNGAVIPEGDLLLRALDDNKNIEKNQDYWYLRDRITRK